jgi:pilus assembly protein CpaE
MSPSFPKRILVVQDSPSLAQLQQQLTNEGYEFIGAETGEQALDLVAQYPFDLAIVEINLPGMDGYELCRALRSHESFDGAPILMLTSRTEIDDKVAGFEAGADDYLTKPYQTQELIYRIRLLLSRQMRRTDTPAQPQTHGRIIALFGTKGGVGRTTIGVNLAIALQRRLRGGKVALFDADFFFGDVALHLNLSPSRTILDLVERIDLLDQDLLDQVLIPHQSGIRVLLSPRNPEDVDSITPSQVERLLDCMASAYDYVIVDCQASYDERVLAILERSDAILLIIKPEVGCIKNMAVFSELAVKLGLPFDKKIHIVLNRSGSKSGIGPKEIERIFRRQIAFHIGSGGNAVVVSLNRGVPLMLEHPSHAFSLQVSQIADYFLRNMPPSAA